MSFKLLGKLGPKFGGMVLRGSPFRIVSGDVAFKTRLIGVIQQLFIRITAPNIATTIIDSG